MKNNYKVKRYFDLLDARPSIITDSDGALHTLESLLEESITIRLDADVPMAMMPNTNEITLLQMDGRLSKDEMKKIIQMNIKAMKEIGELQIKALKNKYATEEVTKK